MINNQQQTTIQNAISSIAKLAEANGNNPVILNALTQIVNTLNTVNAQALGNDNGNLSPNVNNVSDNNANVANVGSADASYQSPASDNVVNNASADDCVSNISPIIESPIVITTMNNCIFNSVSTNTQGIVTASAEQNVNTVALTQLQSWMPFIEKMEEKGFKNTLQVINLLEKHDGNYLAVLNELLASVKKE